MQVGFATVHVIARDRVPKQSLDRLRTSSAISKKGLLRFARNDMETLFSLHPESQLFKLIANFQFLRLFIEPHPLNPPLLSKEGRAELYVNISAKPNCGSIVLHELLTAFITTLGSIT